MSFFGVPFFCKTYFKVLLLSWPSRCPR